MRLMGTLLTIASLAAIPAQAETRQDVLLILIDDLNDWVNFLGGAPIPQVHTPNIDALAERGMSFTNAHAVTPSCSPSRAAMLTGVSPFRSGVYDQPIGSDWRKNPLLADITTLPQHFRESGYMSIGAGKVFHASTVIPAAFRGANDLDAWNDFYPSINRQLADEVHPPGAPLLGSPVPIIDWGPLEATEDYAMGDGQIVNWISDQITAPTDQPRFIAAGIYRPHWPWYVPQRYFDLYPLDEISLPSDNPNDLDDVPAIAPFNYNGTSDPLLVHNWIVDNQLWREAVQAYLASISFADAMVGQVITALEQSGWAENTIILLTSDHGFHLGEKQRWAKHTLWEEATRVPLVFVAPGITTPGSSSGEAVSLLDLYPTLVELAGIEMPDHLDGESLLPLLQDASAERETPAISVWGYENLAVRDDRYRYIRYSDGSEELYDHQSDPNEWNNLAQYAEYDELKQQLRALIPLERAAPGAH